MLIVVLYLILSKQNPFSLKPNEFGDFWAGALGPLGILWIVLGFWQQGEELRNSVEALSLQSEELRNSVAQQKALVDVTKQQAEAQLQALHDEREARKNATSPNIVASSAGGMQSGGKFTSKFSLKNIGADCSKLMIHDLEKEEVLAELPTFVYGDSSTQKIHHLQDDHLNFEILVTFVCKTGEHGEKKFRLKRIAPKAVGFTVEE